MDNQVRNLKETVRDFIEIINSLPRSDLMPQNWGPKEITAHIVFWHETFVENTKKSLNQEDLDLIDKTHKQINLEVARNSMNITVEELLKRLVIAQKRIEKISLDPTTNNLLIPFKKNSKLRSFQECLRRMEQHVRNHANRIKLELGSYDLFT